MTSIPFSSLRFPFAFALAFALAASSHCTCSSGLSSDMLIENSQNDIEVLVDRGEIEDSGSAVSNAIDINVSLNQGSNNLDLALGSCVH